MESRPPTRRTQSVRTGGRSARIVDAIFAATRTELGRVGYTALRIDDVASISGVNKTTVYRRWPTKFELVAEAIRSDWVDVCVRDSGDLRADLVQTLVDDLEHFLTPERIGMMRIFYAERSNPEVEALGLELREQRRRPRIARIASAVADGTLPPGTNPELLVDVLFGTLFSKVARLGDTISTSYVENLVDLVLDGARHGGGAKRDAT